MKPSELVPTMNTPTFDGRMKYFELLFRVLAESKSFGIMGDMTMWYRGLELSYNMVQAYIGSEKQEIRTALDNARKKVLMLSRRQFHSENARLHYQYGIDKELLEIDQLLHTAAKRLYLPLAEGVDEMDVGAYNKKLLRESGL